MPDLAAILRTLTTSEITADTSLRDLGLDALQRAYCLPEALREATGVEVPEREIESWETVGDVQAWVDGLGAAA